jgi:hypothetical protein
VTALSDAELTQARDAVRSNRPVSPMLADALLGEVVRLRHRAERDRAVIRSLSTESLRLATAMQKIRDRANEALEPDVAPTTGNRTDATTTTGEIR